ncbi:DUF1259 domain-containing protein [Paenibacillus hexagrammi]|uniref:DUF1259 domain-containing protein n=1 Tax=Paenibacillus hexagrammi TaxID=2908839 RepID=A0ABY3SN33_9BACL|nr:DUF1259 domain-containing protein [Paenibacillus sp. YPD9-1]UJF34888.1 DUF1259 domain-containing protein [Paenibacillus sp. YPD9-1]
METLQSLCSSFGDLIGGKAQYQDGVCAVTKTRDLHVSILGRPSRSHHTIALNCSFEQLDHQGVALILGEIALLQEEVNPFIYALQHQGIWISALHNHWIMSSPMLMYLHFSSLDHPLSFAAKLAEACKALKQ